MTACPAGWIDWKRSGQQVTKLHLFQLVLVFSNQPNNSAEKRKSINELKYPENSVVPLDDAGHS